VTNLAGGIDLFAHAFTPSSDELVVANRAGLIFFETNRWEPRRRLAVPLDRNARNDFHPGRARTLVGAATHATQHSTICELLRRYFLFPECDAPCDQRRWPLSGRGG
jgi:hypothetical protein